AGPRRRGGSGGPSVTALLLPLAAALGVYYAFTAVAFGWSGLGLAPSLGRRRARRPVVQEWLVQAGLGDVRLRDFAAVMALLLVLATAITFAIFGAILPSLVVGACAASAPLASYRVRRANRRARAQDAWPGMI